MPYAAGLSGNTIRSYKDTFRLLLAYLQEEKGIKPHKVAFAELDYDTLTGFMDWFPVRVSRVRFFWNCTSRTRRSQISCARAPLAYIRFKIIWFRRPMSVEVSGSRSRRATSSIVKIVRGFRLLLAYLQEEKGIKPHEAAFAELDYDTLIGFMDWLEQTRKCPCFLFR